MRLKNTEFENKGDYCVAYNHGSSRVNVFYEWTDEKGQKPWTLVSVNAGSSVRTHNGTTAVHIFSETASDVFWGKPSQYSFFRSIRNFIREMELCDRDS